MEGMWDIKRVLESQGDLYTKVEIQSKSELKSITSSESRVQNHLAFKLMHMMRTTPDLDVLHMHRKIRR
jgi:hypothetical protein